MAKWNDNTAQLADEALYGQSGYKETNSTTVNNEKCPGCGDNMQFDPAAGKLKCPSCGTTKEVYSRLSTEMDFQYNFDHASGWSRETHGYHCNNCNAEGMLDKREIAHTCPFCGSPSVVENGEIDAMRPNAVIPFSVSKDNAINIAHKWAKGKLFAPKDFKQNFNAEKVNGVYLPAFTFDMQTYSVYNGSLGEYYYTTTTKDGQQVKERHTRYFPVSGNYQQFFNDLAVSATDAVPSSVMQTLMDYNYSQSVEYKAEYLYGFSALLYSKNGKSCLETAKSNTKSRIRSGILRKYTYDTVESLDVRTSYYDIKFRYVLLPMYICNYTYKEKSYPFYINGRTGKTKGKSPVSALKVGLLVGGIALVLAALAVAGYFLNWFGV